MFTLIAQIVGKMGVGGVFLLMMVENLVPVIPSELILPLAGLEASRGAFGPYAAIAAATVGSIIGGLAWYYIGRRLGLERLQALASAGGRWMAVTPNEIAHADRWFKHWGAFAVCAGRALPGVRGVICVPAGVSHIRSGVF